jgi:hypothetical protein
MKTIITIILITFFSFNLSFAQKTENSSNHSVKLVYNKSTPTSKQELNYLLKDDKIALEKAQRIFFELCNEGRVILSTREYAPIKQRIESTEAKGDNANNEEKAYAHKVKKKYILVTDLIDHK